MINFDFIFFYTMNAIILNTPHITPINIHSHGVPIRWKFSNNKTITIFAEYEIILTYPTETQTYKDVPIFIHIDNMGDLRKYIVYDNNEFYTILGDYVKNNKVVLHDTGMEGLRHKQIIFENTSDHADEIYEFIESCACFRYNYFLYQKFAKIWNNENFIDFDDYNRKVDVRNMMKLYNIHLTQFDKHIIGEFHKDYPIEGFSKSSTLPNSDNYIELFNDNLHMIIIKYDDNVVKFLEHIEMYNAIIKEHGDKGYEIYCERLFGCRKKSARN